MAFKRLFDDKFIGDKQQRTNYRKWSERAIIVGFNGDTQTYDIVITTERLAGVSKRTLNKTIRNVKSTIPPGSLTFSPGDSVLVGYVSEKREHPVIIGGGGNVVQEAAIVTIGGATTENVVEGGSEEFTGEEGFESSLSTVFTSPACLDVSGLTTCVVDCSVENPFVTITAQGGKEPFSWAVTIPAGCCVTQEISGVGDSVLTLTPNTVVGQTGFRAYARDSCHKCLVQSSPANGCRCNAYLWTRPFDCAGDPTPPSESSPGTACSAVGHFSFTAGKKACCPTVGEVTLSCFADPFAAIPTTSTCTTCASCTGCAGCNDSPFSLWVSDEDGVCGPCNRFPPPAPQAGCCGTTISLNTPPTRVCGESFDLRSEAQKSLGCCPCSLLFGGLPVTITDFDGNAFTINLTVAGSAP